MRAQKQVLQPVAVRRSRRQVRRTKRLGVFGDSIKMEGGESSADTKTSDNYSPGESQFDSVVDLGGLGFWL